MKTVFIDESGYTMSDLLNADQPVFALAAVCIDEDSARCIKKNVFPEMDNVELKHSKIFGDDKNDTRLLKIQQICLKEYKAITYSVFKRYFFCEIFVCRCIMPFCRDIVYGTNKFRQFTRHLSIPQNNLWYDVKEVDKILMLFRTLLASPDCSLQSNLSKFLSVWQNTTDVNLQRLCVGFSRANLKYVEQMVRNTDLSAITPITLFGLITQLESMINEPYLVYCDESAKIREYKTLFEKLRDVPPNVFHNGFGGQYNLPFTYFKGIQEVDSKKYVGIQFADILAGSAVKMASVQYGCEKRLNRIRYGIRVLDLHRQYPLQYFYKPHNDDVDISTDFSRLSQEYKFLFE